MDRKASWSILLVLVILAVGYALRPRKEEAPRAPISMTEETPKAPAIRASSLKFDPDTLDFGEVRVGEVKTATLSVLNMSRKTISILRVGGSCECVGGEIDQKTILGGTKATLKVIFTGIPGRGQYSGSAHVITDESGPCRYDVVVKGNIKDDLFFEPAVVKFGTLSKKAAGKQETRLRHREGKPFAIQGVSGAREGIAVTWAPAEGGGFSISVSAAGMPPGNFVNTISIATDCPTMRAAPLTVMGEVESDFKCTPPIAALTALPDGGVAPCEVVIERVKAAPFVIQGVRESRKLPTEFSESDAGKGRRKLVLRLGKAPGEGVLVGEFLIVIEGQEEPVHLPYRFDSTLRSGQGKP